MIFIHTYIDIDQCIYVNVSFIIYVLKNLQFLTLHPVLKRRYNDFVKLKIVNSILNIIKLYETTKIF